MKAIVIHAAKDLRIEDREVEALGPGQVEVAVDAGGICGSDLHYYNHGGFGAVRLKEPMILGHEIAGTVERVGAGRLMRWSPATGWRVSPSRPCNTLRLLPGRQAEPLLQHALLWLGHANAAHPGSIPSAAGRGSLAVPSGR